MDTTLERGDRTSINLTILAPRSRGTFTIRIGDVTYTLEVTGRGLRMP